MICIGFLKICILLRKSSRINYSQKLMGVCLFMYGCFSFSNQTKQKIIKNNRQFYKREDKVTVYSIKYTVPEERVILFTERKKCGLSILLCVMYYGSGVDSAVMKECISSLLAVAHAYLSLKVNTGTR